jgi:hypothetical protein
VLDLAAPTVLLQWAAGGLLFLWVTTRRREVGLGYGWLQRLTFMALAALGAWIGFASSDVPVRDWSTVAMIAASGFALAVSIRRRDVGVAGQRATTERRSARVAAMTGIDREERRATADGPEFPPGLDLVPVAFGVVGLVAAGIDAGEPAALSIARTLIGAAFLGAVTDAMLLGHWYLVQPGLRRGPLNALVQWTGMLWPLELLVLLWPTGMVSVLDGSIDDGYNGLLGWFWVACVVATIALVGVTTAALREREYSAVMAATGLLYLAILTAFGMDLVARVLLDT